MTKNREQQGKASQAVQRRLAKARASQEKLAARVGKLRARLEKAQARFAKRAGRVEALQARLAVAETQDAPAGQIERPAAASNTHAVKGGDSAAKARKRDRGQELQ